MATSSRLNLPLSSLIALPFLRIPDRYPRLEFLITFNHLPTRPLPLLAR